jgi:tubulin epsilon
MKSELKFPIWSTRNWKTGLCSVPPLGQAYSLTTLANNACIGQSLDRLYQRYTKLFRRKANLHHYLHHVELDTFKDSAKNVKNIIQLYSEC